jgi:hypothetical protein
MAKGITASDAAQRHSEAGLRLSDRYSKGVTGKGGRWQSGAAGAQKNYNDGIQQSISKGSYAKGVSKAGSSKYDHGVTTKGVRNWGPGMSDSAQAYTTGVSKVAGLWSQALSTPRGPKRSPANLQRMQDNVKRFQDAAAQ